MPGITFHDQARSRAYHWGEDGLAGFADDKQRLCLALALWNGAGQGASHQTGWTGFIAKQVQFFGLLDPKFLERGRSTGIFYPEST